MVHLYLYVLEELNGLGTASAHAEYSLIIALFISAKAVRLSLPLLSPFIPSGRLSNLMNFLMMLASVVHSFLNVSLALVSFSSVVALQLSKVCSYSLFPTE